MCVIIVRDPGITIPFSKLESAAIVNPDGWGIAVADRGKLSYHHSMEANPEHIAKALEDAQNHTVLLHLRFNTKGDTILANCHPFAARVDGLDVAFAHNGTLYKYSPDKDESASDSYKFNEEFLSPALARVAAFTGNDNVLTDQFLADLLENQAGSNSKFALLDGNGKTLIINHKEGKEFEGWWSSNEYSFQRNHRSSNYSYYGSSMGSTTSYDNAYDNGSAYGAVRQDGDWQSTLEELDERAGITQTTETSPNRFEPTEEEEEAQYETQEQCQMVGSVVEATKNPKLNKKLIDHLLARKTKSFIEMAGLDSLMEVTKLDPEDIGELVTFYPEASARLIQDLLWELYLKQSIAARNAAGTVKTIVPFDGADQDLKVA